MRILFSILSAGYIAGIFLFAGSPVVSTLSEFNPYSILHIPLFGILTVLLIFSFVPITQLPNDLMANKVIHTSTHPQVNPSPHSRINSFTHLLIHSSTHRRLIIVGLIALLVGIADEIHQAYVPGRDASVTDVLLDAVGIIIVLSLFFRLLKTKIGSSPH